MKKYYFSCTNLHISCSFVCMIFDFFLHISQILFQFAKLPLLKLGNLVQLRFKPFIPERKNIMMGCSNKKAGKFVFPFYTLIWYSGSGNAMS